jgi:hypothetical protein
MGVGIGGAGACAAAIIGSLSQGVRTQISAIK